MAKKPKSFKIGETEYKFKMPRHCYRCRRGLWDSLYQIVEEGMKYICDVCLEKHSHTESNNVVVMHDEVTSPR